MSTWYEGGLCVGLHQEMFYPPLFKEDRTSPESAYYRLGKLVCENCPIKEKCLEHGKSEDYGLWGGHTPKERYLRSYSPPKSYLPKDKLHHMPKVSDKPLDLKEVLVELRPHLKRRTKKGFPS